MTRSTTITIRITAAYRDQLQALADADDRTISYVALKALQRQIPDTSLPNTPTRTASSSPPISHLDKAPAGVITEPSAQVPAQPRHRRTKAAIQEVLQDYDRNMPVNDIAAKHGINRTTVYRYVQERQNSR